MRNDEFSALDSNQRIELSEFGKSAMLQGIHFLSGVLLASAATEVGFSPLGIGFCSGTSREYTLFSCFGAMLGYIVSRDYLSAFRYVMALIIVYVLKAYVNTFMQLREKLFLPALISLFSLLSTGIVVTITSAFDLKKIFLLAAECLTGFGLAYLFAVSFSVLKKFKANTHISTRELTSTIISALIMLLTLHRFNILGFSLAGAVCSFGILCSAYLFREAGGAIIGVGASVGFTVLGSGSPLAFCYCVAGLFSGIFSYSGRVLCAFAYIFSFGSVFLFFEGAEKDTAMLIETALASICFILIPQQWLLQIKMNISTSALSDEGFATRNMLLTKIKMIKNAIEDMSGTIGRVSEILKEKAIPDTTGVYLRVRDSVCTDCGNYCRCWKSGFPGTVSEFDGIIEEIRKNGCATPSATPASLQNRCIRIMSLCDSFNKNYSSYSARVIAEGRINEMRKITADQFDTISDMLNDMLLDFQDGTKPLGAKAEIIKSSIDNLGLNSFVNCYEDELENIFVNVSVNGDSNASVNEIKNAVENVMEKEFDYPSCIENGNEKLFFFWEKTDFAAECIYDQLSSEKGEICGDRFDSFYDGKGNFIAVLSDGMGTGQRAAIDGAMTSALFSRLVIAGFSFPCALRLVNSAMLVKSREESLATLDILKLNLYTGQAVIYKAGATVSLLKRGNKISEIKKSAMPIGILRQAEFGTVRGNLKNGDVLIMMSDGATDNSVGEIKSYISNNDFSYDLPQKLCTIAKGRNIDHQDDITVAVIKVSLNE